MDLIEYFKNLLEKDPDNPMAHYSLAQQFYKKGNYQEALSHLQRYLELQEDEGAGYRLLASIYVNLGMPEKAKEALEKGIQQALKYNHPSMAEEFRNWLSEL